MAADIQMVVDVRQEKGGATYRAGHSLGFLNGREVTVLLVFPVPLRQRGAFVWMKHGCRVVSCIEAIRKYSTNFKPRKKVCENLRGKNPNRMDCQLCIMNIEGGGFLSHEDML